jgi:hypothetical protein
VVVSGGFFAGFNVDESGLLSVLVDFSEVLSVFDADSSSLELFLDV